MGFLTELRDSHSSSAPPFLNSGTGEFVTGNWNRQPATVLHPIFRQPRYTALTKHEEK